MSAAEVDTIKPAALGPRRAVLVFLAFLLTQVFVGAAVGVAGAIAFMMISPGGDSAEVLHLVVMPASIAAAIVGGLVAFGVARRMLPGPVSSGALASIGWRKAQRLHLLVAAVAGLSLSAFYLYGLAGLHPSAPRHVGPVTALVESGGLPRLLWAVLALLIAPPIEEFVFRGVMFTGFRRSWGGPSAATVTVFLFALIHLTEAHGAALLSIVLLGYAAVIARTASESLLAPITLHAAYNLGIVVAAYG
jgi:membrane protease YdiL (CAAX protease family)